jgi:hypothetical protein
MAPAAVCPAKRFKWIMSLSLIADADDKTTVLSATGQISNFVARCSSAPCVNSQAMMSAYLTVLLPSVVTAI